MTNQETIRAVIDRVLWTAGATEGNRRLLAEAISESLAAPAAANAAKTDELPMDETSRHARLGAHIFDFAKQAGWKDDGEGAFEFIQRQSYAVGIEDAGGTPPSGPRFGNRWPIDLLEAATAPNTALVEAAHASLSAELLSDIKLFIEERATEHGYGFYRPENPHDFHPDGECCSEEEMANHKAACEAWDKGEYEPEPGSEWVSEKMHITRAPWGIGGYSYRMPDVEQLLMRIAAALAAHAGQGAKA